MTRHFLVLWVAGAVCLAPVASARQSQSRTIYVSVVDKNGAPALNLRAADIAVQEDGSPRRVVSVGSAQGPARIAILVDDHGLGLPEVRRGLSDFMDALRGRAAVGVLAAGRQDPVLVGFTTDASALSHAIELLVPGNDEGVQFLEQLFVTAKQFETERFDRNVFVALTVDMDCASTSAERGTSPVHSAYDNLQHPSLTYCSPYEQNSRERPSTRAWQDVAEQLARSRAAMFSVVVRHRSGGDHGPIFDAGPQVSGGTLELPMTDSAIPSTLQQVARQITNQYAVTYESPSGPSGARLRVKVNRPDVTVRAPERAF